APLLGVRQLAEAKKAVRRAGQVVYLLDSAEAGAQRNLRSQFSEREDLWDEARLPHKAEAGLLDRALDLFRLTVAGDAERLEHIADGDAELGADTLLAVHHDRHARRRD